MLLCAALLAGSHGIAEQPPSTAHENSLGMRFIPVDDVSALVSVFETRVRDYQAFVDSSGAEWEKPEFDQGPDHPAVNVSWRDAVAFCEWLGRKEGRHYRLPTDQEWSILAGIGHLEKPGIAPGEQPKLEGFFPWGTTPASATVGNYCDEAFGREFGAGYEAKWFGFDDGHAATAPVGSYTASKNGLHDLAGNVWEWVDGWYDPETVRYRIVRGGSWRAGPTDRILASFRGPDPPSARLDSVGFRVVLEPPAKE